MQARLAAAHAPLRPTPRLTPRAPLAGVAPVSVRLAKGGPTWTAVLHTCDPPRNGECPAGFEPGSCECAVLVLSAESRQASLVVSETAALGRPRLLAVPRADGTAALFLGADLYDRSQTWPRVGFLVDGAPDPVLAWREEIGACHLQVAGDPEDERSPQSCDAPESAVRWDGPHLVLDLAGAERRFTGIGRHP